MDINFIEIILFQAHKISSIDWKTSLLYKIIAVARMPVTEEYHYRTHKTYRGRFLRQLSIQPVSEALYERVSSRHYHTAIETLGCKQK